MYKVNKYTFHDTAFFKFKVLRNYNKNKSIEFKFVFVKRLNLSCIAHIYFLNRCI